MTKSFEKKLLGGLGLASIIIAGVTVVYHSSTTRLLTSAERVGETHELITALSDLARGMQTARMTTRGYVLTGDADIYQLHQRAEADVQAVRAVLRRLLASDPHRQTHIVDLERHVESNLRENTRLLELRELAGGVVASLSAGMQYRDDVEDPLPHLIEHMMQEARTELATRERLADAGRQALGLMLLFGAIVELVFAIAAAYVLRRYMLERQRATEQLRRSELTLRNFYDSGVTVMGIAELLDDGDVRIVSANSVTARHFGVEPQQLIGRRVSEMGSRPEIIRLFVDHYHRGVAQGAPVQFEYERETANGRKSFTTVVCPIAGSASPQFSFVVLDETERKAAERALQQHASALSAAKEALEKQSVDLQEARRAADAASAAKTAFLANMSHEIRTPMTAVVGYAELLGEANHSEAQRREWSRVIRRNAAHLLDLLNDILDISKIEAGKMIVETVACDIVQLVNDVAEMMRHRAVEKGVALRVEIDEPIARSVATDPLRLRQVLVNLVGNAIKFTEAGEVAVGVACAVSDDAQANLMIEVRDTGIGMTPEQIQRIFHPFTQADGTTTRRFGGSGLGLTITKRLVEMLGGTIDVHSEPGLGSKFRISVPVQTAASALTSAIASGDVSPLRGRVLVVDDDVDMQRLIALLLSRAGAEVVVASGGAQAVEMASAGAFDLILMDMQMSPMDGLEATGELRRRGIGTPIIALTANAMIGDRERCLAVGCDDYLTKPLDRVVLLARVQDYLHRRRRISDAKVA